MSQSSQNRFLAIREDILQEIRPTPEEIAGIKRIGERLEEIVRKHAKLAGVPINFVEIEGSTGLKQTQLRNASDIDAFIGLPETFVLPGGRANKKVPHRHLEELLSQMVRTWLTDAVKDAGASHVEISYAEHPYLSAKLGRYDMDVILCVDLPEKELLQNGPITAMDRSPWHSRYLDRTLTPDQKDDVRLLKRFLKASHAYGDAPAPGQAGFIGYAAELLVAHLGSFWAVIDAFPELPQMVFDPFKRTNAQLRSHARLKNDLLLIIDPTDRNRNVAASISPRAYRWVNARAREFRQHPTADFFQVRSIPEVATCPTEFKVVEFRADMSVHYTIHRDKLYSWATAAQNMARFESTHEPRFQSVTFELYFQPDNPIYGLAFHTTTPTLPDTFLRQGPPTRGERTQVMGKQGGSDIGKFLRKHPDAFEKDGFYWIHQRREYTDFLTFLTTLLKQRPAADSLIAINTSLLAPTTPIGRQAVYVLRDMVLPFEKFP